MAPSQAGLTRTSQRDSNARGADSIKGLLPSVFSVSVSAAPVPAPKGEDGQQDFRKRLTGDERVDGVWLGAPRARLTAIGP